jgi:hypothetical protein
MEDWRDTLWCWYDYIATGIWTVGARTRGGARIQRRKVDDILEDAIRRKYLLVAYITPDVGDIELPDGSVTKNSAMDARLSIDDRGRNFLKPLPFFEASLKEYGHVVSFFLGAGGTLLVMFWNSIIDYLAKF